MILRKLTLSVSLLATSLMMVGTGPSMGSDFDQHEKNIDKFEAFVEGLPSVGEHNPYWLETRRKISGGRWSDYWPKKLLSLHFLDNYTKCMKIAETYPPWPEKQKRCVEIK